MKKVYKGYVELMQKKRIEIYDMGILNLKTMALITFREYQGWLFPGYITARKKEYFCDVCVCLQFIIKNPNSTEAEKTKAWLEKELHLSATINQRQAITHLLKLYG